MKKQVHQRPQQSCAMRYPKQNEEDQMMTLHQPRTMSNGYRPVTEVPPVNRTPFTSPKKTNNRTISSQHDKSETSLPPPPPPLPTSTPKGIFVTPTYSNKKTSTESKMSSRAHLVHVRVLHKNAILVTGLPKREFDTTKAIEQEFKKYGIITNCLVNPKGISVNKNMKMNGWKKEGLMDGKELLSARMAKRNGDVSRCANGANGTYGTIYIRFLHEKAAMNAILATNGKYWGKKGDDGDGNENGNRIKLHSCFVNNRYCDEFLQGRYCQDLNCILLHELVKSEKRRPNTANANNLSSNGGGNGSVTSSDSSSNASMKSPKRHNCWKTPRNYLVAKGSTRANLTGQQDEQDIHFLYESRQNINMSQSNLYPKKRGYTRNDYDPYKSISAFTDMNVNSKSSQSQYRQYPIVTPQHTGTRYSQDHSSMMSFASTTGSGGDTSAVRGENIQRSRVVPIDLPVRQLFKNTTSSNATNVNNVIAPPSARRKEETIMNGIDIRCLFLSFKT